jgi:hypothetical protein
LLYQKKNVIIPDFKWTLPLLTFSCIVYFWMQPNATWKNVLVLVKLFIHILAKTFLSSSNYSSAYLQNMNNIYLKIHKYTPTWGKFVLHSTVVGPAFYIILGFIFLGFFFLFLVHQVLHDPKKKEQKDFISWFHVEWWMQQLDWV